MLVELDVGGIVYKTTQTTLTSFKNSFFTRLFDGDWKEQEDKNGRIFIDRDGHTFRYVLEFLRNGGKTVLPNDKMVLEQIKLEAEFFSLPQLTKMIDYHMNITLKEVELVFVQNLDSQPFTIEKSKIDGRHYDSIVLTLAQMLSVPNSFFWHLANNIINRTPKKLSLRVELVVDGRYYVAVTTPYFSKQVATMVKMGKSKFDAYTAFNRTQMYGYPFIESAKQLGVPFAIEHGVQMEQIQKEQR